MKNELKELIEEFKKQQAEIEHRIDEDVRGFKVKYGLDDSEDRLLIKEFKDLKTRIYARVRGSPVYIIKEDVR